MDKCSLTGAFLALALAVAPAAGARAAELQQDLVFTGAVAADSKNADAAKAFLDYLRTPEAAAVLKAQGMTVG